MSIIIANIQVLKMAIFPGTIDPIALGTIIFATSFTASDMITEYYGVNEAKKCIKICFLSQIIMMVFMILTITFPTTSNVNGLDMNGTIANPVQYSMYVLFIPSFRIAFASLVSYYISQIVDIQVFRYVSKITNKKKIWLRFNVASLISGLCDNIIFSVLAWVVLSPKPVSMKILVFSYIFGTYLSRIIVAILSTPVMYIAKKIHKTNAK